MAVSPGKKEPCVPGYVSRGKEPGSGDSGKPVKDAQALCSVLHIRKFPAGCGEQEGKRASAYTVQLISVHFPSLPDLGT